MKVYEELEGANMWSRTQFCYLVTPAIARLPINIRSRLQLGARVRSLGLFEEEKRIGVRPFFSAQSDHWLSPFLPLSYSRVWSHLGIAGMNYVSVSLTGSSSEILPLYNLHSPYYHTWFCVYAIIENFRKPFGFEQGKPISSAWIPLAISDQDYWRSLVTEGPVEESYFTFQSEIEEVKLPYLSDRVFIFRFRFSSYSILIPKDKQSAIARLYFALPEEREWNAFVNPGHPIEQGGVGVVWHDNISGVTFYAGGIGASFVDKHGIHYDYIPIVEAELLTLLGNLRFRPLWRG